MDIGTIVVFVLCGLIGLWGMFYLAYGLFNFGKAFWSLFKHTSVPKNAILYRDAKIVDVRSDKVQYVKNGSKYKTTVRFSDGFRYITHETERDDNFLTYQISISPELYKSIIECAKEEHDRAFEKQQKRFKSKN